MKRFGLLLGGLLLASFASLTCAQSDPGLVGVGDWTGPLEIRFAGALVENAPVTMLVPSDGCFTSGSRILPDSTEVRREGNEVTIDFYAYVPVCFSAGDPLGVWTYQQELGAFPAGTYAVTARYHYVEYVATPPFAVLTASMEIGRGAAAPATLPSLSTLAAGLLVVALAVAGMLRSRRRRLRI